MNVLSISQPILITVTMMRTVPTLMEHLNVLVKQDSLEMESLAQIMMNALILLTTTVKMNQWKILGKSEPDA